MPGGALGPECRREVRRVYPPEDYLNIIFTTTTNSTSKELTRPLACRQARCGSINILGPLVPPGIRSHSSAFQLPHPAGLRILASKHRFRASELPFPASRFRFLASKFHFQRYLVFSAVSTSIFESFLMDLG